MERMVGRQVLRQNPLELHCARFAGLALLVIRAAALVEVTWAGDVGVLEGIRPSAELTGAGFGERYEI